MSDALSRQTGIGETTAELALAWFQRVMAGYCLLFGTLYWVKLIGYYPGNLWRFDLMPSYWQVAAVTLAVFFPFAAAGLWMLASWGVVVWFICAAMETIMYAGLPQLFGRHTLLVATHLAAAAIYLALRVLIWQQKRRKAR